MTDDNKKVGWIIYSKKRLKNNNWFCDKLKLHLEEKGFSVQAVMSEELKFSITNGRLSFNSELDTPSFAIIRDINPKISYYLEQLGIKCFNNHKFSFVSNNKNFTHTLMQNNNIPLLDTQFVDNKEALCDHDLLFSFPLVLKPVACHGGSDVSMVNTISGLNTKMQSYRYGEEFSLQKVCSYPGRDLRVYCLGQKIITAVLRESACSQKEFRANYALGGKVKEYHLNEQEKALVQRVINIAKGDFFGVDFLFNDDGKMVFNEMEDVVGTRMLYSLNTVDILKEYAEYIAKQIK